MGLIEDALKGDEEATKIYCGSYNLCMDRTEKVYFRYKGSLPDKYKDIKIYCGEPVFDSDGYLKARFWSLPRMVNGQRY